MRCRCLCVVQEQFADSPDGVPQEVTGWINAKATVPVWAKMTPNVTDITLPARVALQQASTMS